MFQKVEFVKSVFDVNLLPKNKLPEVVLCGRSNVGKSSFINSLLKIKNLAKVSSTPGKTKSINYFLVDEKFYLVDLPGFGYAAVSKAEKEKWSDLITFYFNTQNDSRIVIHLIDIRHPGTKMDQTFAEFLLAKKIIPIVILTKQDKAKQSEISSAMKEVKNVYDTAESNFKLLTYSAVTGFGRKEVLSCLKDELA